MRELKYGPYKFVQTDNRNCEVYGVYDDTGYKIAEVIYKAGYLRIYIPNSTDPDRHLHQEWVLTFDTSSNNLSDEERDNWLGFHTRFALDRYFENYPLPLGLLKLHAGKLGYCLVRKHIYVGKKGRTLKIHTPL